MPRTYVPKTGRKNAKHKVQGVPVKFKAGFLTTMDGRTDLARALRTNYDTIVEDIGGQEDVGHVKKSLVERFVWLEAILQTIEHEIAQGNIGKLGVWIQAVNSLSGLAKTLGIERKARAIPWMKNGFREIPKLSANAEHMGNGHAE
jgi:hypothetical protein